MLTAEDRKIGSGPGLWSLHRCLEPAIPAALTAHEPLTQCLLQGIAIVEFTFAPE